MNDDTTRTACRALNNNDTEREGDEAKMGEAGIQFD
jgi:hypothetical protein